MRCFALIKNELLPLHLHCWASRYTLSNSFVSGNVFRFTFLVCIHKALHSLTHCSVYFHCLKYFLLVLHSTFYVTIFFFSGTFLQINVRIFALITFFSVLIINKLLKIPKMLSWKCISYVFFKNYNHFEWSILFGEKQENKHHFCCGHCPLSWAPSNILFCPHCLTFGFLLYGNPNQMSVLPT